MGNENSHSASSSTSNTAKTSKNNSNNELDISSPTPSTYGDALSAPLPASPIPYSSRNTNSSTNTVAHSPPLISSPSAVNKPESTSTSTSLAVQNQIITPSDGQNGRQRRRSSKEAPHSHGEPSSSMPIPIKQMTVPNSNEITSDDFAAKNQNRLENRSPMQKSPTLFSKSPKQQRKSSSSSTSTTPPSQDTALSTSKQASPPSSSITAMGFMSRAFEKIRLSVGSPSSTSSSIILNQPTQSSNITSGQTGKENESSPKTDEESSIVFHVGSEPTTSSGPKSNLPSLDTTRQQELLQSIPKYLKNSSRIHHAYGTGGIAPLAARTNSAAGQKKGMIYKAIYSMPCFKIC
jgi:hypothetical protein